MINQRRVRFLRKLIYAFIVLIIFLPIILMTALNWKMTRLMDVITQTLERSRFVVQEAQTPTQYPDEGYVIPAEHSGMKPEDQSVKQEEKISQDPAVASGQIPEATVTPLESTKNAYQPADYPNLYFDTLSPAFPLSGKTVYLTFDNTPSFRVDDLLALLDRQKAKATFFVWFASSGDQEVYNKIIKSGHSIGIHSYSPTDSFAEIYSGRDYFFKQFDDIFHMIESATGVRTRLYRLPGGSINQKNPERQALIAEIKAELDARGFLQYDWNASAQDAVYPAISKETILNNIVTTFPDDGGVILMHDGTGSESTLNALDELITNYKAQGFQFKAIDYGTAPVSFLDK